MKRLLMAVVWVLLAAAIASAQLATGNITGTVQDEQGGVLPGVTITLQGTDRTASVTTDDVGKFRFLNLPPGLYTLTTALQGFTTLVRENIEVRVGQNVDLPIALRVATVQETVTVTGESPLIDTKAMGTATNFTQDELSKIPNSRDPWALLRAVPGVVVDRINVAGNETGQQSGFVSKGTRREDAVWTLDGIVITDMAAVGASPTYFDYDAFDEIQISTSGQDIRQPTGGVGLNFVVKRGTNRFRGTARGYFTNDSLEGSNVPDELNVRSAGGLPAVTAATADHNKQISDYGFDAGGPILKDRAWVWGSWTKQDIRLVRASGNLIDRTLLTTTNLKGNWQATKNDMVSVLWFNGAKEKFGRGTGSASFEPPSATWNQGNNYPEDRPHGLLKLQDDRVVASNLFLSVKYAYYGTGFKLEPAGGLDGKAGISAVLGQSFGTTRASRFLRPQNMLYVDSNYFGTGMGANHDVKFGVGWRRTDATSQTIWPGDMVVGYHDNNTPDGRYARLYREGQGTNRTEYWNFYVGDTISVDRATLDVGLRYDHQSGRALPSATKSNGGFPTLVPGIKFDGYEAPFTWKNFSPRIGVTYALDDARKSLIRASFARYAGQLETSVVGYSNPSGSVGFADYRWNDANGDNFAQPSEVLLNNFIRAGGGFNPAAPTAVTSSFRIDPDLEAPVTTGVVVGFDRELRPNLAAQVTYTFSRTTGFYYEPFIGFTAADYAPGAPVTGTIAGGGTYSIPTFIPNQAKAASVGFGRIITNYDGYRSQYSGIEVAVVKRMSDRWMTRLGGSWNNATEYYDMNPKVNYLGNPTRRDTEPLNDGGQFAPRTAGSGAGDVFVNGKWQLNVNGVYQLPADIEVAGNLFAKQGTPFPVQRVVSLGADGGHRVLVSPELDTDRLDDVWNLDLRAAKNIRATGVNLQVIADLFNVFNGNYAINRLRNVASPNYNRITQNLSPRILRIGLRLTFN